MSFWPYRGQVGGAIEIHVSGSIGQSRHSPDGGGHGPSGGAAHSSIHHRCRRLPAAGDDGHGSASHRYALGLDSNSDLAPLSGRSSNHAADAPTRSSRDDQPLLASPPRSDLPSDLPTDRYLSGAGGKFHHVRSPRPPTTEHRGTRHSADGRAKRTAEHGLRRARALAGSREAGGARLPTVGQKLSGVPRKYAAAPTI